MRRFLFTSLALGSFVCARPSSIRAQQPAPTRASGTLSVSFADPIAGRRGGYVAAMLYDEITGRNLDVTLDSALVRSNGGLTALRSQRLDVTLASDGRVLAITGKSPRPGVAASTGFLRATSANMPGRNTIDPARLGPHHILALGCSFAGVPNSSWPGADFDAVINGKNGVADYFAEVSSNQISIAGGRYPDEFRPMKRGPTAYFPDFITFNPTAMLDDCIAAYKGTYDPSDYDIVIVHAGPVNFCCEVAGRGYKVKKPDGTTKEIGWALIVQGTTPGTGGGAPLSNYAGTIAHELGHSLGLFHVGDYAGQTYVANWDVLGKSTVDAAGGIAAQLLAGHKEMLGWIPDSRRYINYGGTGTITLERNALPASNSNYLVALIPFGSSGSYYTVELRQKAGFDAAIPREGVLITLHDNNVAFSEDFLIADQDGSGDSNGPGSILGVGKTFFDPANQIAITLNSIVGTTASVTIRSGGGNRVVVGPLSSRTTAIAGTTTPISGAVPINFIGSGTQASWTAFNGFPTIDQFYPQGRNRWLQVLTASGVGTGQVRFQRDVSSLAPGTYVDSIRIQIPNLPDSIWMYRDTLVVTAPPALYVGLGSPSHTDSTMAALIQDSTTISISGPGAATAAWTATSGGRYVRLTQTSGTGNAVLHWQAGPNLNSLPGWYVDTLVISLVSNPSVKARLIDSVHFVPPVHYTVTGTHHDSISTAEVSHLDSMTVSLNANWATDGEWQVMRTNSSFDSLRTPKAYAQPVQHDPYNNGNIAYRRKGNGKAYFKRFNVYNGATGRFIDTLLINGPFPAQVTAQPTHEWQYLWIDTLYVYAAPASLKLSKTSHSDTMSFGMTRSIDSVTVIATGTDSWATSSARNAAFYLNFTGPTPGTGIGVDLLRWSRNFSRITAPGVYVDTLTVTIAAKSLSARFIDTLVVLPGPTVTLSAPSRSATAQSGTSTLGDSVNVDFLGTSLAWTAIKKKTWTTLATTSGTGAGTLRWTRNPSGLSAGIYVDTISVGAGGTARASSLIDTLIVAGAAAPSGVAIASFDQDSLPGVIGLQVATTLSLNMAPIAQSIGSYSATIGWDSLVVRLDSARSVTGGFASPTVTQPNGSRLTVSATDASGKSGSVPLVRLYFHFTADVAGRQTQITPSFSAARAGAGGGGSDLLSLITPASLKAVVIPGALRGDVNLDGKLTTADALLLLRFMVGIPSPTGLNVSFRPNPNGDANCNGKNEAIDAQLILAKIVGLPTPPGSCVGTIK